MTNEKIPAELREQLSNSEIRHWAFKSDFEEKFVGQTGSYSNIGADTI
jgi:hypothetical protein